MTDEKDDRLPEYAPSEAIDIALADTIAGRHWLHPAVRHRNDPRLLAIRAKNRALYLQRTKRAGR